MKNKQEIVNQLESLKPNETFIIRYYATKHKKIIERLGSWFKPNTDTKGKNFTTKDNREVFVYWDLKAEPNENGNQWRKAINPLKVMVEKANSTILNTIGEVEND